MRKNCSCGRSNEGTPHHLASTARLEHSPINIHLKANMKEETSALMVSARMYGDSSNLQETSKVTHSINHQILLVKHEV